MARYIFSARCSLYFNIPHVIYWSGVQKLFICPWYFLEIWANHRDLVTNIPQFCLIHHCIVYQRVHKYLPSRTLIMVPVMHWTSIRFYTHHAVPKRWSTLVCSYYGWVTLTISNSTIGNLEGNNPDIASFPELLHPEVRQSYTLVWCITQWSTGLLWILGRPCDPKYFQIGIPHPLATPTIPAALIDVRLNGDESLQQSSPEIKGHVHNWSWPHSIRRFPNIPQVLAYFFSLLRRSIMAFSISVAYVSLMILKAFLVAYGMLVTGSMYLAGILVTGQYSLAGGLPDFLGKNCEYNLSSLIVMKFLLHFFATGVSSITLSVKEKKTLLYVILYTRLKIHLDSRKNDAISTEPNKTC